MDSYELERTGLLFVDSYNDFLSDGGGLWPMVEAVAKDVGLLDNLRGITAATRKSGIRGFIDPHHRWEQGDYEDWDHPIPYQFASGKRHTFAKGSWGGEWHPDFAPQEGDIIIKELWGRSGFANPNSIPTKTAQDRQSHINRNAGQHLHRIYGPFRYGAGLSRNIGQGCNCSFHQGYDARNS